MFDKKKSVRPLFRVLQKGRRNTGTWYVGANPTRPRHAGKTGPRFGITVSTTTYMRIRVGSWVAKRAGERRRYQGKKSEHLEQAFDKFLDINLMVKVEGVRGGGEGKDGSAGKRGKRRKRAIAWGPIDHADQLSVR